MAERKPVSLAPLLDVLYRHRFYSAAALCAGIAITLCLLAFMPSTYRSSALVLIEWPQVSAQFLSVTSPAGSDNELANHLDALTQLAFDTDHLEQLIDKYDLYKDPSALDYRPDLHSRLAQMRRNISLVVPGNPVDYEDIQQQRRAQNSTELKISFENVNPHTAYKVTAALADLFMAESLKSRLEQAQVTVGFLNDQAARQAKILGQAQERIKELKQHYAGSLPEEIAENVSELDRLEEQLKMLDEPAANGGANATESPVTKLAELRVRLAGLQADYNDNYPDIVDTKAEISQMEKSLRASDNDRSVVILTEGIVGDGNVSARRHILEEKIAACQRRIDQTPQHAQELSSITSDYDAMMKEYHDLLSMQLAAEMQQEVVRRRQGQRVGLIEAPSVSRSSATPNRVAIATAGTLMSLMGALVIPFLVSFTDTSFNNEDELREEVGFPVIVSIPNAQTSACVWMKGLAGVVLASSAGATIGIVAVMAYRQLHF